MHYRALLFLPLACVFAGSLSAADPFVGKWMFNQSQSKMTGTREVIEDLGDNKYKFSYGTDSWMLVLDGSDQPSKWGGTRSMKATGENAWVSTSKMNGQLLSKAEITLSADGKTKTHHWESTLADGTKTAGVFEQKRASGTKGLAGTWESTENKSNSSYEFDIEPYGGDGLSFIVPAEKDRQDMKFDGKYYPDTGPHASPGATSAAKRVDERTIEWTDKLKDEVTGHQQITVSADGKTLTMVAHFPGEKVSQTYVYDRQ